MYLSHVCCVERLLLLLLNTGVGVMLSGLF